MVEILLGKAHSIEFVSSKYYEDFVFLKEEAEEANLGAQLPSRVNEISTLCDHITKSIEASKAYSCQFSIKVVVVAIDIFTVYDAILAGGQTRLKLQGMYGILAHLEPL